MMYTVSEFAARMKVHPRTIRRLIVAGRLPARNLALGGQAELRIDEQEAMAALAYRPPAPAPRPLPYPPTSRRIGRSVGAGGVRPARRPRPTGSSDDARSPSRWSCAYQPICSRCQSMMWS
jgi:excisionase family DNA binding protein